MKKHLLLAYVLSVLVLLTSGQADALPITIYDSTGGSWTVSWNDPRVGLVEDTTDRSDGNLTKQTTSLRKVVNFTAGPDPLAPIVLTFTEDQVALTSAGGRAPGGVTKGLNFLMTNIIFNETTLNWTAFEETLVDRDLFNDEGVLIDLTVDESNGKGNHPAKSHFHTPIDINPNPPPWKVIGDPDGDNKLLLSNPPNTLKGDGAELDFSVRIHDVLVANFKRRFDLTETPAVLEPASLTLLGVGGAGLLGYAWRRRRRG